MSVPNQKRILTSLDWQIAVLEGLRRDMPELLRRRAHEVSDGYPASSMGGSGGNGGPADPTARAALTPRQRDAVGQLIDHIIAAVGESERIVNRASGARELVFSTGESERGRQSSVYQCRLGCTVTGLGDDRLRAGYCPACKKAWTRYAEANPDPSHIIFQAERIKYLAEKATRASA